MAAASVESGNMVEMEMGGSSSDHHNTNNNNNNPSQSILSEKVTRALQVRTDTPAMKAALDALSHLHTTEQAQDSAGSGSAGGAGAGAGASNNNNHNNNSYTTVDSRSVRVAIEQDALHQALLLQEELRALLSTVQGLREGVSATAAIAHRVKDVIHTNVVSAETTNTMLNTSSGHNQSQSHNQTTVEAPTEDSGSDGSALQSPTARTTNTTTTTEDALAQEQKLAAVLSDAFLHRDISRKRLSAVHAFLEKFDLSQEDSRLLDHYSFEDIISENSNSNSNQAIPNGTAFLKALERVRRIRQALTQTFGTTGDLQQPYGSSSSSNSAGGDHTSDTTDAEQRLGASSALRMMESLAQKQERAYERLYHWLQQHLHLFSSSTSPGAGTGMNAQQQQQQQQLDPDSLDEALQHPFVKRSLYTLRHVPAFYSHTLELVAASRRSEETRRFLLALTSGYGGNPPIEMKAHDSVAYVGDMLAFSFKAFSVEADVVKGLVLYKPQDDDGDDGRNGEEAEKEKEESGGGTAKEGGGGGGGAEEAAADEGISDYMPEAAISAMDMLSISVSGLARPLKSRILQVVATLARRPDEADNESDDGMDNDVFDEEGITARTRLTHLYEICGLLLFYAAAMDKSVQKLDTTDSSSEGDSELQASLPAKEKNPLVACLLECLTEATKAYEATIRVYGAMLDQLSASTGDSEASLAHSMVVVIADVRMSSPGFSVDVSCPPECTAILSIEWATETLVQAALGTCKALDDVVALKQSLAAAKKAGMKILESEKLDEQIDQKEIGLIEELVEKETSEVLDLCGLGPLAAAWKGWQDVQAEGTLMSAYPGLSPDDAEAGMKEFYSSLYSPPLPSLEATIKDPVVRKSARSKIAGKVCETYSELYNSMISTGKGGYDDVSFLGHKPEQVNTLFSA
jgi:hypothetical protein